MPIIKLLATKWKTMSGVDNFEQIKFYSNDEAEHETFVALHNMLAVWRFHSILVVSKARTMASALTLLRCDSRMLIRCDMEEHNETM